jgi:hypothetical protein
MTQQTQSPWWLAAVDGQALPRSPDDPQPGYYKTRVIKRGPWVACRIWRDDTGELHCRVGDEMTDPVTVWTFAQPVTVQEWAHLEKLRQENPTFNPRRAVDLRADVTKP